jgi:chemotaxis-related protein WspB
MLFLVFRLDRDRYAIDASQVIAVVPLVEAKAVPQAPAAVAGVIDFRGRPVPLIDLCQLVLARPARQCMSTRVIVVRYPLDDAGNERALGLVAEQVLETVRRDLADFSDSGISHDAGPYLGPVCADGHGLLQYVRVEQLLPASLRDLLFREPVEG